jgi:membrane protein
MTEQTKRGFSAWQLVALVGLAAFRASAGNDNSRVESVEPRLSDQAISEGSRPGWLEIIKRTFAEFSDDRILALSAGVTFYVLLALFPGLAALVSLYGLFADPVSVARHVASIEGFLPQGATEVIGEQLTRLSAHRTGALGFGVALGIGISLWSASAGVKALFDALNVVFDEREKRGFIKLSLIALAFTLGALGFMLIALSAVVGLPLALQFVGLGEVAELLLRVLRWPALLAVVGLALAVLYAYGPSRTHFRWRWISWGSAFASITWIVGSFLFSWYVQNFGSYDKTYGSLGAVIGFMTWIWLSTTIVLLGAELNSELEKAEV